MKNSEKHQNFKATATLAMGASLAATHASRSNK